jgi:hypothetical protein
LNSATWIFCNIECYDWVVDTRSEVNFTFNTYDILKPHGDSWDTLKLRKHGLDKRKIRRNGERERESFILKQTLFSVNKDMQQQGNTLTYDLV